MIKINLLPIRAARKREYIKQQLVLFVVVLVGAFVGLFMWYSMMEGKIDNRRKEITHTKQKIEQYKKAIGEVTKYKGLEEELNRKLKTIEDLIKSKVGPVRVLDRMSMVTPKQVWLLSWEEKAGRVTLTGEALSNKHVAQFMSQLGQAVEEEASAKQPTGRLPASKSFFSNVRLVETELLKDTKLGRAFVKFKIQMQVSYAI